MAWKASKSTKPRISDRAFKKEFTKIISGHLSLLPAAEQDRRIQAATQAVLKAFESPLPL